jgi:hypothetical protein
MRYALAMICPPLALMTCHRSYQAILALILYIVAIFTARWGIGAFIEFFLILWATNAVGDEQAGREAQAFVKTVKPIPFIHE